MYDQARIVFIRVKRGAENPRLYYFSWLFPINGFEYTEYNLMQFFAKTKTKDMNKPIIFFSLSHAQAYLKQKAFFTTTNSQISKKTIFLSESAY